MVVNANEERIGVAVVIMKEVLLIEDLAGEGGAWLKLAVTPLDDDASSLISVDISMLAVRM